MGCVDENGNRIFTNAHMDALKKKSNSPIQRISKKIMELSGIGTADEKLKEAKKNSDPSDDSSYD